MIRKVYFFVQPIPVIGKLSRFLNVFLRKSLTLWLKKKNSILETKANSILEASHKAKFEEKFRERSNKLNFPEAE